MEPKIYDFSGEFKGTKEQAIQWLGQFNLEDAPKKVLLLSTEEREDFRQFLIQRSKEYLSLK